MSDVDVIATLRAAADRGDDIYQDAVTVGIAASEDGDNLRWLLGDLANLIVEKRYGKDTIAQFAKDTKTGVSAMRGYRTVSAAFPPANSTRVEYWTNADTRVVSWSHFREALRMRKVYGERAPQMMDDFIRHAATNTLSVEAARVELTKSLGKPTPPRLLWEGELSADASGGDLVFRIAQDGNLQAGKLYTVKVYEATE